MALNRYSVKYWSGVEWGWIEYEVLAQSEEQIREMVDKECALEHRMRPYAKENQDSKDSLEIVCQGEVDLPYVL